MDKTTSRTQSNSLKNNWGTMFKGIGLPAAGALAAYIALHTASSRGLTKHQIIPFKRHRLPTLAFAACSAAAFALGHTLTGPYRTPIESPLKPEGNETPPEDLKQKEEGERHGNSSSIRSGRSNPPTELGQHDDHEIREGNKLDEDGDDSSPPGSPQPSLKSSPRENYLDEELRGEDSEGENDLFAIDLTDDVEEKEKEEVGEGQLNGSQQPPPSELNAQIISSSSTPGTPPPSDERSIPEGDEGRSDLGQSQEGKSLLDNPKISTASPQSEDNGIGQRLPQMLPQTIPPPDERSISEGDDQLSLVSLEDIEPPPELFMGQFLTISDSSEGSPPYDGQEAPSPNRGILGGVDVMDSYMGVDRKEETRDQKTIHFLIAAAAEGKGWEQGPYNLNAGQVKKVVKAIEAVDRGEHHGLEESKEDAPLIGIVSGLTGKDLLSLGEGKDYLKAPPPQEKLVAPSSPGVYNEQIHGPGGINMKGMQYSALMREYGRLFKVAYNRGKNQNKSLEQVFNEAQSGSLEKIALGYLLNLDVKPVPKELYVEFCQAHRKLLESDPQGEALTIGRCLAWARFMPNIQAYQNAYVREHIKDFPKKITAENFHKVMKDMNVAVDSSPQEMRGGGENLQKIKLYGELSLCNYFEVNPQTLRNQEIWEGPGREKRIIYHLRHATPNAYHYLNEDDPYGAWLAWDLGWAAGTSDYYTKIDPAYTAFLDFAEENGEGVLYACHQKISDRQEGKRCSKLIELEESGKHPNLLLLFQSVEFPGFMNEAKTFEELKETLKQSFEEGAWNRLPQQVRNDKDYKKELWQVFDEVKKLYYGDLKNIPEGQVKGLYPLDELGKGKYHPTHTQKMIMDFYDRQREHLKFYTNKQYKKYKVTYVNSGCKDNFDRGFDNNCTTDRNHQTALFGKDVPEELLIATATSGMGVTLHGKGIGILGYRLAPALLVSKLLGEMDLDAEKQEKMKRSAILSGWKLKGCGLPLQPNQPATPLLPVSA